MMFFLKEQNKINIHLSEDEKTILETLLEANKYGFKEYELIGRTAKGGLYTECQGNISYLIDHFCGNLFQFIHNGDKYDIEELLNSNK